MNREHTITLIGSLGFAATVTCAIGGAFTNNNQMLVGAAIVGAVTAGTCVLIEARKGVTHENTDPMVEGTLRTVAGEQEPGRVDR